jgi:predicted secreted protein
MSHSKEANYYWKGEHVRYLNEENKVPSVEERVKEAFDAGVRSVCQYEKLNAIALDKCQINFPNSW